MEKRTPLTLVPSYDSLRCGLFTTSMVRSESLSQITPVFCGSFFSLSSILHASHTSRYQFDVPCDPPPLTKTSKPVDPT